MARALFDEPFHDQLRRRPSEVVSLGRSVYEQLEVGAPMEAPDGWLVLGSSPDDALILPERTIDWFSHNRKTLDVLCGVIEAMNSIFPSTVWKPTSTSCPSRPPSWKRKSITMTYGPFEEDVYIAGMPTFHIAGGERGDHGFFGSEMFLHLRRHAFGDTGQLGQNHAIHGLSRA